MVKYLTEEGLKKLKKELQELKTTKRGELAERLQKAIAFGDLSENFAYHEAKEAQGFLEGKIIDLTEIIRNAVIISDKNKTDAIDIGSTVTLEKGQDTLIFQIVGAQESNPRQGKISNESPLGKALLGKKKGDIAEIQTPEAKIKYKILKIE